MRKKSLLIAMLATGLMLLGAFTSFAGWEQQADEAWKYRDDTTGVYVVSQWIESATEKGLWYYVGQNGVMAVNTMINGQYYVNEKGEWRESAQAPERDPNNRKVVSTPDGNRNYGSNANTYSDMHIEGQNGSNESESQNTPSSQNNGISWGDPDEKGSTDAGWGVDNVKVGG